MSSQNSRFHVVVNHEEQYSVWPATRDVPDGWFVAKTFDSKEQCLDYIEATWTDIRPKSLRDHLSA